MFKKQLNPGIVAAAVLVILAIIQGVYWRLLVYRPPQNPPGMGGGGGGGPAVQIAVGRNDVQVETWVGGTAGYEDGPAWQARFSGPNSLALHPDGSLLVTDSRNHRLRQIAPGGRVSTLAGGGAPGGNGGKSDGPAAQAQFRYPSGVAVDGAGTIYVADTGNHRICRLRDGQVTTLCGGSEGSKDGAGTAAQFRFPAGLAMGPDGALWVADVGNRKVRRVDVAGGTVSSPAAAPAAVQEALGETATSPRHAALTACADGVGEPGPTDFKTERLAPSSGTPQGDRSLHVAADPALNVVVSRRGSEPLMLLAGRVAETGPAPGLTDGTGLRAAFAMPCATLLAPDGTVYVAEFESNCIRRLVLPEWLRQGGSAPVRRRSGPGGGQGIGGRLGRGGGPGGGPRGGPGGGPGRGPGGGESGARAGGDASGG